MKRDESGFTLIELLVSMAILGVVLTGVSATFVSGLRAESQVNRRFQAAQQLLLAIDRMRRQVHPACLQHTNIAITGPGSSVTIDMPNGGCDPDQTTPVTWCVRSISTGRYGLYQVSGSTCTGGRLTADYISSPTPFTYYPQGLTANAPSGCGCGALARLHVDISTFVPGGNGGTYHLVDDIAFRNSRPVS